MDGAEYDVFGNGTMTAGFAKPPPPVAFITNEELEFPMGREAVVSTAVTVTVGMVVATVVGDSEVVMFASVIDTVGSIDVEFATIVELSGPSAVAGRMIQNAITKRTQHKKRMVCGVTEHFSLISFFFQCFRINQTITSATCALCTFSVQIRYWETSIRTGLLGYEKSITRILLGVIVN